MTKTRLTSRRGLTLIELLVAVTIMVIMIGAFNLILKSSSDVVKSAQQTIRFNAAASAFLQNLKNDLAKVSPEKGFLCITQKGMGTPPVLMMLSNGPTQSRFFNRLDFPPTYAPNGKISVVGMASNFSAIKQALDAGTPANNLNEVPKVLYYQPWALTTAWPLLRVSFDPRASWDPNDVFPYYPMGNNDRLLDATYYHSAAFNRTLFNQFVDSAITNITPTNYNVNQPDDGYTAGRSFRPSIEDIYDLKPLWQSVSEKCMGMSIQWTDGTFTNNQLNWYGPSYSTTTQSISADAQDPLWTPNTDFSTAPIEYAKSGANSYGYRALWTFENPTNWPKALRICFVLKKSDGGSDTEDRVEIYEIICPVGGGF